jgi:hypothetical protein
MKDFPRIKKTFPLALLLGVALTGCGGGDSDPPPASPAPPQQPVPPPPPASTVPPLSSTVVSISDNHQIGVDHWSDGNTATGAQGQPVANLECMASMPETYHVHTHVSIFLNGEALSVPPEIGIVPQTSGECFYSIHTHDKSGKIHIEAAAPGTFTLGQLFAIWGQPLVNTNIAGLTGMPVSVYVTDNGVVTEVADDWQSIELKSHREITIAVGTPITSIPNITWNGN